MANCISDIQFVEIAVNWPEQLVRSLGLVVIIVDQRVMYINRARVALLARPRSLPNDKCYEGVWVRWGREKTDAVVDWQHSRFYEYRFPSFFIEENIENNDPNAMRWMALAVVAGRIEDWKWKWKWWSAAKTPNAESRGNRNTLFHIELEYFWSRTCQNRVESPFRLPRQPAAAE